MKPQKFMNTNYVGHHVSAGAYIFTATDINSKVLLIENKKGEWWVPKGHIEEWENELTACYREIEEEVGLKSDEIYYLDFLEIYKFSFLDKNNKENTKEIHLYVFKTDTCLPLDISNGGSDIVSAKWFSYEEAVEKIIPFCRKQLENAFSLYVNKM